MTQYFGYISGFLLLISFIPYLIAIFKGEAKPERASWLLWTILGGISFFSLLSEGATNSLWLPGVQAIGDALIFILSIKYGLGGLMKRDKIALAAAGMSLLLWYFTKEASVALVFAIIIDGAGAVLTMIKSYEEPITEPMSAWVLTCLGGFIGIFAVGNWQPIFIIFPLYIFVANLAIIISILLGRKNKKTSAIINL